ncbi:hypothetical protein ACCO45_012582 [Purpureocillium lilacinum]|uniref:Uncharacterized protein n=1 Tax=Purpureocillium lilacinum TaxID=33203 RepID=A0ACC4D8I8_PURLI
MFLSAYSTFYQLFLGVSALVVLGNMVLLGVRFLRRGSAPQAKDLSDRDIARSKMSRARRCDNILAKGRELW